MSGTQSAGSSAVENPPVVVITCPGRTALRVILVEPIEVGRACPGILIDDPAVSRRHLELRPVGPTIMVHDLGSANGTTLDGRRLSGPTPLLEGQALMLGDVTIRLVPEPLSGAAGRSWPGEAPLATREGMTSIERVADAVVADRSALGAARGGHTRTIVFSDIEGSTQLAVSLGDVRWFELLEVHNTLVRTVLRRHDGTEVKSQGDGFMLTFPSARRAVAYMIELQQELQADPALQEHRLRVRIGAHTGESVETDDGDLFGRAVIAAARIGAAAEGGEILVSSLVREIVDSWDEVRFGISRVVELKGLGGQWMLHPVDWGSGPPLGSLEA